MKKNNYRAFLCILLTGSMFINICSLNSSGAFQKSFVEAYAETVSTVGTDPTDETSQSIDDTALSSADFLSGEAEILDAEDSLTEKEPENPAGDSLFEDVAGIPDAEDSLTEKEPENPAAEESLSEEEIEEAVSERIHSEESTETLPIDDSKEFQDDETTGDDTNFSLNTETSSEGRSDAELNRDLFIQMENTDDSEVSLTEELSAREEADGIIEDDFIVPLAVIPAQVPSGKRKAIKRLPSSYDSRLQGCLTAVKNQGDSAICWAYSASACAEASAILKGMEKEPDYSERHLAWYFSRPVYQTTGVCGADATYYISMADDYMHAGGNNRYTTFALANWIGLAGQTDYPDDETWIDWDNAGADIHAVDDLVHLENAAWISMTDVEYIKQKIMSEGCVASSYYYKKGSYYNAETHAYYNNFITSTNHAINLVGWDDSYPAENFLIEPECDGAWLVRNSWGTDFGEEGYFWISYCDSAISSPSNTAFAFDFRSAENFDNLYYYDGSCGTRTRTVHNGGSFANVFTACGNSGYRDECIEAVGVAFPEAGLSYEVYLYTDLQNADDPTSGILASSVISGVTETSGYQTLRLDNPVNISYGASFSVVVRLYGMGPQASLFVDRTYENSNWIGFLNETQKGQSFVEDEAGGWVDLHTEGSTARIKAFTGNLSTVSVKELTCPDAADGRIILKRGTSMIPAVNAVLSCGVVIEQEASDFRWTSSDPSIVSVSASGEIIALHPGQTILTLQSEPETGAVPVLKIPIEVYGELTDCRISLPQNHFPYTGKNIRPVPEITDNGETLRSGIDYKLRYNSCLNAGKASVTVTGTGFYRGTATASYIIDKASQSINAHLSAVKVAVGKTSTISVTGNKGAISFKSSNTKVATVSTSGKITAKKVGSVTINVKAEAQTNYHAAYVNLKIKVVPAATTSVIASNKATGIRITWKKVAGASGYRIYRDSKLIKTVTKGTTVTYTDAKANTNGSKYTYKVIATASTGISNLSKSTIVYRLSRPAISSIKNVSSGKAFLKWKKNTKSSGIQIRYTTDKTFLTKNRTITISGSGTISRTISGLKRGQRYYVIIRTYRKAGSNTSYSSWSPPAAIRISR